jgi:arylsulfatase
MSPVLRFRSRAKLCFLIFVAHFVGVEMILLKRCFMLRLFLSLAVMVIGSSVYAQSALNRAVRTAANTEPSIPRPEQDQVAFKKLNELFARTGKRPNVLWLIVDDMGYGDPGCYGGGTAIGAATPNMDRLSREGLRLTSCYSQNTCTPTRSAILTGRLPVRTGLTRPILAGDKLLMNPWQGEVSLPKLLSDSGYYTLLSGKWHVGEAKGMRPHDVGFDEFYGYYPAQKEITQSVDEARYPDLVLDKDKLDRYRSMEMSHSLIHGWKDGKTEEVGNIDSTEAMGRADEVLAEFTIKKIAELSATGKPFFIEHAFMKVHTDNYANPKFKGISASKYAYKDAMCEVDLLIGRIVDSLEKANVLENTFIFVTSDNGPQMDGWPDSGYTPFRGAKGTTWEGGVRVPGIAYWKGMIKGSRESDDVFDLMDLFNTTLRLAGIVDKIPADRYIDGIDQTSFLLHDQGQGNRECVFFWWETELMAVRMREYKMHRKFILPQSNLMHIDMSVVQSAGTAPWLFNLYIDPKEELAVGHRMNAWLASLGQEMAAHGETFKKYPPKKIGL